MFKREIVIYDAGSNLLASTDLPGNELAEMVVAKVSSLFQPGGRIKYAVILSILPRASFPQGMTQELFVLKIGEYNAKVEELVKASENINFMFWPAELQEGDPFSWGDGIHPVSRFARASVHPKLVKGYRDAISMGVEGLQKMVLNS